MNEYDVLFSVIVRFEDTSMDSLDKKVEDYSEIIGDCISEVYPNCFIAPIAMEESDDNIYSILKNFKIIGEEE